MERVFGKMSLKRSIIIVFILMPILVWCSCSKNSSFEEDKEKIYKLVQSEKYEKSLDLLEKTLQKYSDGHQRGILLLTKGMILTEYYVPDEQSAFLYPRSIEEGISSYKEAAEYLQDSLRQLSYCYISIVKHSITIDKIDEDVLKYNRAYYNITKNHNERHPLYHYFAAKIHFELGLSQDSVLFHIDKAISEMPESIILDNMIQERQRYIDYYNSSSPTPAQ